MVFCCIAIVGIAILYLGYLMLRHLLIGPRRDWNTSKLPAPPRAITGNAAQPVFGHTRKFTNLGGDLALLFPPTMREWRWLPKWFSRQLGSVFSIFIWGQWRIAIQGPVRAQRVLDMPSLKDGWAWSPPVTLLGKSCPPLLEEEEADFLMGLLNSPLSHANVLRYAPEFADLAEQFMDDLVSGALSAKFDKGSDKQEHHKSNNVDDLELGGGEESGKMETSEHHNLYKIKWDAMRSYTLDLIDGPVFGMNKWNSPEQSKGEATGERKQEEAVDPSQKDEEKLPERQRVMLWMDRLKAALCVVKFPMGPEWMYLWPFTEYGRACIGRVHLQKLITKHVAERSDRIENVRHEAGHFIRDFSTTPIPLYAMMENFYYRNESVTGGNSKVPRGARRRAHSESALFETTDSSRLRQSEWTPTLSPTAEDHAPPPPPLPMTSSERRSQFQGMLPPNRARSVSSPHIMETSRKVSTEDGQEKISNKPKASILDHILSQHDISGAGLSNAVATELSILLYMILDAGNAWTAMALNLLSLDHNALTLVQDEIDCLAALHGKDKLFTPRVLGKMTTVDALLWEAIRLCPPFCGGMKVTTETVVLEEDGVQIPKNTNVIFCQPTDRPFDLSEAMGKKPQDLTLLYPCINIHGFLPFKGLEIPIMCLQSKVFIIALLQRFSPHISKKRTFIRRVKDRFSKVDKVDSSSIESVDLEMGGIKLVDQKSPSNSRMNSSCDSSLNSTGHDSIPHHGELTTSEAMKLFTKIPFPEPRLALHVNDRNHHAATSSKGEAAPTTMAHGGEQ